ncbi:MAG: hypothetical protein WD795_12590 [Woeseia sp.]
MGRGRKNGGILCGSYVGEQAEEISAQRSGDILLAETPQPENETTAEFSYTYFKGVWTRKIGQQNLQKARILDRVNYGLVNLRTDGKLIMCATQRDSGGGWTIQAFKARFPAA